MQKFSIVILILAGAFFAACVNAPNEQNERASGGKAGKVRIGFSMDTLKEHWVKDKDLLEQHAAELGAEIITSVADSDDAKQLQQIDDMLTRGVDVLIIVPHNGQIAATAVAKAKRQNVPVISYDRLILSDEIDLLVSHLHSTAGRMQAEYALQHQPIGNYVMIYGPTTDNNAAILRAAQLEVLKPAIERGDIKIVAEQNATNWLPEAALKIAENALTQNKNEVAAIIASNDGTAGGAAQALNTQGLKGKVILTGMDAQIDAMQRIAQGEQSMTVYKPIKPLAFAAAEAAVRLAGKEKIETTKTIKVVNREVPFIFIEPKTIDKSNLLEVVKDGFQDYDQVFANVPPDQRPPRE